MDDTKVIPFPKNMHEQPRADVQARVLQAEIAALKARIGILLSPNDRALFAHNLGRLCEEYGEAFGGPLKLVREAAGSFLKHRKRYIRLDEDGPGSDYARSGGNYAQIVDNLVAAIGGDESLKLRCLQRLIAETSLATVAAPAATALDDREQALRDLAQIAARISEEAQLDAFFKRVQRLPVAWDDEQLANGKPPTTFRFEGGEGLGEAKRTEYIARAVARIAREERIEDYFNHSGERPLPIAFRGARPVLADGRSDGVEAALLPSIVIGVIHVPVAVLSVDIPAGASDVKLLADPQGDPDACASSICAVVEARFGCAPPDVCDDWDAGGRPTREDRWSVREWSSGHVDGEWVAHAGFIGKSTKFWGSPEVEDWDRRSLDGMGRAWRRLYVARTLELTLQPSGDRVVFGLRLRKTDAESRSSPIKRAHVIDSEEMNFFIRNGSLFMWRPASADFVLEAAEETLMQCASTAIHHAELQGILFEVPGDLSDAGQAGEWEAIRMGRRALELSLPDRDDPLFSPVAPDTLAGRLLANLLHRDSEHSLASRLLESSRALVAKFDAQLDQTRAAYDAAFGRHWGNNEAR